MLSILTNWRLCESRKHRRWISKERWETRWWQDYLMRTFVKLLKFIFDWIFTFLFVLTFHEVICTEWIHNFEHVSSHTTLFQNFKMISIKFVREKWNKRQWVEFNFFSYQCYQVKICVEKMYEFVRCKNGWFFNNVIHYIQHSSTSFTWLSQWRIARTSLFPMGLHLVSFTTDLNLQ